MGLGFLYESTRGGIGLLAPPPAAIGESSRGGALPACERGVPKISTSSACSSMYSISFGVTCTSHVYGIPSAAAPHGVSNGADSL